jgi:hypothetical protein
MPFAPSDLRRRRANAWLTLNLALKSTAVVDVSTTGVHKDWYDGVDKAGATQILADQDVLLLFRFFIYHAEHRKCDVQQYTKLYCGLPVQYLHCFAFCNSSVALVRHTEKLPSVGDATHML